MSQRVYTLITPAQRAALNERAARADRSLAYMIARAIGQHIDLVQPSEITTKEATEKVFTRVTPSEAKHVKEIALSFDSHEWRIVNAAVTAFLSE